MNDELHNQPPDIVAALDQAKETLPLMANALWSYYLALREEGFSEEAALRFVGGYQESILNP